MIGCVWQNRNISKFEQSRVRNCWQAIINRQFEQSRINTLYTIHSKLLYWLATWNDTFKLHSYLPLHGPMIILQSEQSSIVTDAEWSNRNRFDFWNQFSYNAAQSRMRLFGTLQFWMINCWPLICPGVLHAVTSSKPSNMYCLGSGLLRLSLNRVHLSCVQYTVRYPRA